MRQLCWMALLVSSLACTPAPKPAPPPQAPAEPAAPNLPSPPSTAHTPPAPPPQPKDTGTLLRAAHVLDVNAGSYLPDGTLVFVRAGTIHAIGREGELKTADGTIVSAEEITGAKTIELAGATLMPGLVDMHTHLLHLTDPKERNDHRSTATEVLEKTDVARALRGARFAREMLDAGFTTVRDVGNSGLAADVGLRDAIRDGDIEGPTMFVTTRALAAAGGQFAKHHAQWPALVAHEYREVSGQDDARAAVREAILAGADGIKVIVGSETANDLTVEEVKVIVDEAHRTDRWVAAHCTDDASTIVALDGGVDTVDHGYGLSDAVLKRMAKEGVPLIATDLPLAFFEWVVAENPYAPPSMLPAIAASLKKQRAESIDRLRRAKALGVTIVAGSDTYYPWEGRTRGQIAIAVLIAYGDAGLSPAEIAKAATVNAAVALGREDQFGRVAAGLEADLVAVDGDLLADASALARVRLVMTDGRIATATNEP